VETSTTVGYVYPERVVFSPTMSLLSSVQEPVFGLLPAAQSRLHDWMLGCFKSLWNLS